MTTALERRHRPFANGSHFMDWVYGNCDVCHVADVGCAILAAIDIASIDDGRISMPIAIRMGTYPHDFRYGWRCPEFVPIESLIAERNRPRRRVLDPLLSRIWRAVSLAVQTWGGPFWWTKHDPWESIGPVLAWQIAWGLHRDDSHAVLV